MSVPLATRPIGAVAPGPKSAHRDPQLAMFRTANNLVVTQWEHSRLSGRLAVLIGQAAGVSEPRLFGAIALHDWPHFAHLDGVDEIEIGTKSTAQQLELLSRLAEPLPLDPYTELIVRLHWRRMSDDDAQQRTATDPERIEALRQNLGFTREYIVRLDHWTNLCDTLAFFASRVEAGHGEMDLPDPSAEDGGWKVKWRVAPGALQLCGLPRAGRAELSVLAYAADGYPTALEPSFFSLDCTLRPT